MKKMHVKVVLDLLVLADEDVFNPEDYVEEAILNTELAGDDNGVIDIQDMQMVSCEVTDSR